MSAARGPLAGVAAIALAAGGALAALADVVPGPPLQPDALAGWYEAVGPATATAGLVRSVGLALAAWLFLAATLQLASSSVRLAGLGPVANLISPRSLQRLGYGLAGLSLTAGLTAPAPSAGTPSPPAATVALHQDPPTSGASPSEAGTATMHRVDPASSGGVSTTTSTSDVGAAPGGSAGPAVPSLPPIVAPTTTVAAATTTSLPSAPGGATPSPAPPVAPPHPAGPAVPVLLPPAPVPGPVSTGDVGTSGTVVVQPGDSLWSIAEEALMDLTGRADAREVDAYWRRVVAANRSVLTDPLNPDLIFAGQVIVLPPV